MIVCAETHRVPGQPVSHQAIIVAEGPGIWTETGPPFKGDVAGGGPRIIRSRRTLPTGPEPVPVDISHVNQGSILPFTNHPADIWTPISYALSFVVNGTEMGDAALWKLTNPRDFPRGLPVYFTFNAAHKDHLARRFDRYEKYGPGAGRSRFSPAMRVYRPGPTVFKQDNAEESLGSLDQTGKSAVDSTRAQDTNPRHVFRSTADTFSRITPHDPLYQVAHSIGEFLLTIDLDHVVKHGWSVREDPDHPK